MAQHAVDQVLQHRQAFLRIAALAVHDAHAADAVRAAVAQEFAQQRFGGLRGQAMQIQFLLCGVFAAGQALEDLRRYRVAPVAQQVAGFQRGDHRVLEFVAGRVLVATGHLRRGLRFRRGRRQRRIGQDAHLAELDADGIAEQRGIVHLVVGGRFFSHRCRVSQRPSGIIHRMQNVPMR